MLVLHYICNTMLKPKAQGNSLNHGDGRDLRNEEKDQGQSP